MDDIERNAIRSGSINVGDDATSSRTPVIVVASFGVNIAPRRISLCFPKIDSQLRASSRFLEIMRRFFRGRMEKKENKFLNAEAVR